MAKFKAFDGRELNINNFYRGGHCFLLVNGPSLNDYDTKELTRPGIMTIGINNGPAAFRPNLWIMADDNTSFVKSIWLDPKITKFVPEGKKGKELYDNDKREWMDIKVGDCAPVVYYERDYKFEPEKWLTQDTLNWGCKAHICACGYEASGDELNSKKKPKNKTCPKCNEQRYGKYNIMYLAVGLAYHLGFRTLNILGADFHMSKDHTYAFEQKRHRQAITNNNNQYIEANRRFDTLRPIFEKAGFSVRNCYKDSGLKSFDYVPFDQAIQEATASLPPVMTDSWGVLKCDENTADLYDRKHDEKEKAKRGSQGGGMTLDDFLRMKGK